MVKKTKKAGKAHPGKRRSKIRKLATGIERLDTLLNGGFKKGDDVLLMGPNFAGRELIQDLILINQLKNAVPAVVVLSDMTPIEFNRRIRKIYNKYILYEKRGYVHYIDLHSKIMGLVPKKDKNRRVSYVKNIENTQELMSLITQVGKAWWKKHDTHAVMFRSLHTLYNYMPSDKINKFMHAFAGRTTALKATSFYDLSTDAISGEAAKGLTTYMETLVEVKVEEGIENKYFLRVRGMDDARSDSWVEFEMTPTSIRLTGPFKMEIIK